MNFDRVPIDEEFESTGEWWSPNNPEHRFSGELHCSPEQGIRLTVGQMAVPIVPTDEAPTALHGVLDGICPITIFNPRSSNWHTSGQQQIASRSGLIGACVADKDAQVFEGISCATYTLPNWCGRGPFSSAAEVSERSEPAKSRITYEIDLVPIPLVENGDGCWQRVEMAYKFQQLGDQYNKVLSYEPFVRVAFSEPLSFTQCMKEAYRLELLLSLLVGRSSISRVRVCHCKANELKSRLAPGHVTRDCSAIGEQIWLPNRQEKGLSRPTPTSLATADIGGAFRLWEPTLKKFEPVLSLVASSLYGRGRFVEDRFLLAAQAIEGYCRIDKQERYLSKAEFERLKEAMEECFDVGLDPEGSAKLKAKLSYFNDFSLKDRILSLLERKPLLLEALKIHSKSKTPDAEGFAKHVRDARNQLTHVDLKRKKPAFSGEYLNALATRIQNLLCLAILEDLEVQPDTSQPHFLGGCWWSP